MDPSLLLFSNTSGVDERSAVVGLPTHPQLSTPQGVATRWRRRRKRVLTFLGFGELGYEDERALVTLIETELAGYSPADTVVNTGTLITLGFRRGIADVYPVTKQMMFNTIGISPSIALHSPKRHALSAFVDEPLFIADDTWGGLLPSTGEPSQTLSALLSASDEVVAIGGGKHTAQELLAFLSNKTPVRFHALDMHHSTTRDWVERSHAHVSDFRGAAYHAWQAWRGAG
jgi:hypothetical protein